MAKTTLTGVAGEVTVGDGPVCNIYEWEADFQRDVYDDSHFDGDNLNARTKVGGMSRLVGRCSGYAQVGTTPDIGSMDTENEITGGSFSLIADQGTPDEGYIFSGLISDMTVDTPKNGLVAVSFSFRSQGAVALIT